MASVDRRDFLKIVGLSAGAAAATGCREPIEKVIPYLNQPEEVIPGIPTYYASTCRECPAACGVHVKTREGRPIKVDGSPDDPVSQGRLCVRGQASLYRTYDATRFAGPLQRVKQNGKVVESQPLDWDRALELLVDRLQAAGGKVAFLSGLETGTLGNVIDRLLGALGASKRIGFEPLGQEALRTANELVFGTASVPHFALDRADVVVAFGTDFLETWLNPLQSQVLFSAGRRTGRGYAVHVGPRLGLSGANADEWLAPEPGTEVAVALALAAEVARRNGRTELAGLAPRYPLASVAEQTGVEATALESLAARIADASAPLALPPGNEIQGTNATDLAAAVQLLNYASGAIGTTVVFGPDHNLGGLASVDGMKRLAAEMRGGEVSVLLVHGANPVYALPQIDFAGAMSSPGVFSVSFASADDETAALADLVLPDDTPFEAWGDAEPIRGVWRLQQPTVRRLKDTRATGQVLLEVGRKLGHAAQLPAGDFKDAIRAAWTGSFEAALEKGGEHRPAGPRSVALAPGAAGLDFQTAQLEGAGDLTLLVYPSLNFYDGRSARSAVLQEIPNPVTKLVWDSYAELHPETAERLGVEEGEYVRIETETGHLELAASVHAAVRPGVVAIEAGQGHQPVDPAAPDPDRHGRRRSIGANALELVPFRSDARSGGLAWLSARARVQKLERRKLMPRTQATFDQEGRGVAQAIPLAALLAGNGHPADEPDAEHGAGHGAGEAGSDDIAHLVTREFDPAADARDPVYRWGMAIDLDACTGCNACVTACVQENNIATIGENLVRQGREMHWIRIERYVEPREGGLEVRHVPMLCQHCGAAPCESVCPVFATYHNAEGLNVMVPNRCIGTRYCANNCPYKARRFNYFSYDWEVREPENLALNPDVTVRAKGVMEKCTFCVQRINAAKDRAAVEGRSVQDGEMVPACAQSCPSKAIAFGNYKDPESRVSQLRRDPRAYSVLHSLNTRPAITYLKSVDRRGAADAHAAATPRGRGEKA